MLIDADDVLQSTIWHLKAEEERCSTFETFFNLAAASGFKFPQITAISLTSN